MARPACTPATIRAVLAANAAPAVPRRYDEEPDAAFEQTRQADHRGFPVVLARM